MVVKVNNVTINKKPIDLNYSLRPPNIVIASTITFNNIF